MSWNTDWLNSRARITPDRIAVVDADTKESWTYGQLEGRAEQVASSLSQMGITKGERVALLSPNHISYFDLLFACTKLGAIFVPINWRLAKNEISFIISDCQPKVVIYDTTFKDLVPQEYLGKQICLQGDYDELFSPNARLNSVSVEAEFPLAIIYTGGTTGKPKGAVLTHQSMFYNAINTITSWNLNHNDTTLTFMPMFHSGGLNALSLPLLHIGGKVVIGTKFEPERILQLINEQQCTIALFVPTMYHLLIETEAFKSVEFPTMHTFLSGGAPCSYRIYDAFAEKGLAFKEGYGLTEAGPNNFYINPADVPHKRGSVGKPMMYNNVKIITDDGTDVKAGDVGEIVISGYHLFSQYWNNPAVTNETVKNGWLFTGDLGKFDQDGYFYIVGRKKDMIITGGENVFPLEVEHIIAEHDAVAEVAVVGLADMKWGEVVTAFIVIKQGKYCTETEIEAYCKKYLGGYKVPKIIRFVTELPKTPVGKIDKKELVNSAS